jgi:hypothetical protein
LAAGGFPAIRHQHPAKHADNHGKRNTEVHTMDISSVGPVSQAVPPSTVEVTDEAQALVLKKAL